MSEVFSKIYIFIILVVSPVLTLFSLFGLFPFYPVNFFIIGFGFFILIGFLFKAFYIIRINISINDCLIASSFTWFFIIILCYSDLYSYTEDGRYISAF
ncbi:hypothetical protein DD355_005265, partial [Escherichia coli]|nr:hypothetical protein [Escherichia coli]